MGEGVLVRATVAARRLGVTADTVRRWVRAGVLDGKCVARRWYVHRDALRELVARRSHRKSRDDEE